MKIVRKTHTSKEVSTASMPDIIFMLLVFFMVTTVMREFEGLDVLMPRAQMIEKLESKRHTAYIWATKDGLISVNDRIIAMNGLSSIMYERMVADPKITVSLKSDENATMKLISDIHTQLREANALKLSYAALTETP
ncbi:MAG: biopolymer transporter ExbD [Candidatus Marinimicrobia bacterium]|jgi:biopolymer transport protein ExbD|nr:biopolymer transporter ExbD [Candidatus Neomarinimicrobiota bacterium]MBT6870819.1 biopolymer transporter ExbD [Candidatus Neomarinimicrobiota bacterium]MBT7378262.1 biopolymer transporter ExbD [Candidatus Neomarinimicrobiota bacterium]|tara:strand:- start:8705 stop:9115 length:411 start_codon:yes stop_codon:yes gene_type:complete